jgi:hypothetical protein
MPLVLFVAKKHTTCESHPMKYFAWNPEKNARLKQERGVVECPRIYSTDLDALRLLAEWH